MAWIKWHRRQRRLPTTYVEVPPEVEPRPLELDLPAFGPEQSFSLPEPGFPTTELTAGLLASTRPIVRYRPPQQPPAPEGPLPQTPPAGVVEAHVNRALPGSERQRVLLGDPMADLTVTDVDVSPSELGD